MKIVLDTNVFVSGVFFGGPPGDILEAWHAGRVTLVVSLEILAEYQRVGEELAHSHPHVDLAPFLDLLAIHAVLCDAPPLEESVCADADDDKFFACAITGSAPLIVSGDKHLLNASGKLGVEVLRPREIVDRILQ